MSLANTIMVATHMNRDLCNLIPSWLAKFVIVRDTGEEIDIIDDEELLKALGCRGVVNRIMVYHGIWTIDQSYVGNLVAVEEIHSVCAQCIRMVGDMSSMFANSKIKYLPPDLDTSKVTNMSWMFMRSAFNGDLSIWHVCSGVGIQRRPVKMGGT